MNGIIKREGLRQGGEAVRAYGGMNEAPLNREDINFAVN